MPRLELRLWIIGGLVLAGTLVAGTAAAQKITVTAASPASGEQGTTSLVVKISGRNFAPGSQSQFFKSGTTDPSGITVHGTQFVSATEVDATIDIADTASLALFDIQVTAASRSGKGSDLFQVIQKTQQKATSWACMITFDSTLLDPNGPLAPIPTAIQGDGAGPYINGSQGVACSVAPTSEFWSSGRLFVKLGSRYLLMPGQTAVNVYTTSSYPTIHVAGSVAYFEIWDLKSVDVIGQTLRRPLRMGSTGVGDFRGDNTSSYATQPNIVGSSSAWVSRLTGCSWRIAWYPWAPLEPGETAYPASYPTVPRVVALIQLGTPKNPTVVRLADFALPMSATVTLIQGAQGCN